MAMLNNQMVMIYVSYIVTQGTPAAPGFDDFDSSGNPFSLVSQVQNLESPIRMTLAGDNGIDESITAENFLFGPGASRPHRFRVTFEAQHL